MALEEMPIYQIHIWVQNIGKTCFHKNSHISLNHGPIFKIWHAQLFDPDLFDVSDMQRHVREMTSRAREDVIRATPR